MSEVKLSIGGRIFHVACDDGEETELLESSKLLDQEAEKLQNQLGKLPEDQMLLMAGLILGDRLRSKDEESRLLGSNLEKVQQELISVKDEMRLILQERDPSLSENNVLLTVSSLMDEVLSSLTTNVETDLKPPTEKISKTGLDSKTKLL